jgi:hypothetical protein
MLEDPSRKLSLFLTFFDKEDAGAASGGEEFVE